MTVIGSLLRRQDRSMTGLSLLSTLAFFCFPQAAERMNPAARLLVNVVLRTPGEPRHVRRDARLQAEGDRVYGIAEPILPVAVGRRTRRADLRHRESAIGSLELLRCAVETVMKACTISLSVLILASACAAPQPSAFPHGELVDLSHTYDAQTIYWPTAEGFRLRKDAEGMTPAGYYYTANSLFTSEHGGTHIDAPIHFAQGRQTVDAIPLDRLIGPAVVIDVTAQSEANADYQVTTEDVARFEREHGVISDDAIVLIRTDFSRRWPDAARYLGTATRGEEGAKQLHFPGLHPDAARWLVANRRMGAVGIDTASIDYGQSALFESHRVLYERDVPAFENMTALDRLPVTGAVVIALPMKIGGGSGAPLRAIAILPQP
jgi:kynurenine formamidase